MTNTPHYVMRLTSDQRAALAAIAASVVPDDAMSPQAAHDSSRISAMLRMIADGRLVVVVAAEVEVPYSAILRMSYGAQTTEDESSIAHWIASIDWQQVPA